MKLFASIFLILLAAPMWGQQAESVLTYSVETSGTVSNGNFAPVCLTSNRFGLGSSERNSGYLRAGVDYRKLMKRNWKMETGLQIATGANMTSDFWIQQAYLDFSWKMLNFSIGAKERMGFPLEKNSRLTTGWMTEGINTRPIPQIRGEIKDFLEVPGLNGWLAFKGHIAYGKFMDSKWQENFVKPGNTYTKGSMYHSKSILFRLGNIKKVPVDFEFGIIMATQFAGDRMRLNSDGSSELLIDMPDDLGAYWSAFLPQKGGSDTSEYEQYNVEGNMLGSWNFALNYYCGDWKFRMHLDHYFEDHSQMFWEYGRWKDGQLGLEITPPMNKWISGATIELMSTKDQTGPIQYEENWGSLTGMQTSGCDNYYNHYMYNAWQHYGMAIGNPLILGPAYNSSRDITFKSNRVKAVHLGIQGDPGNEWKWRLLLTSSKYWGTYTTPLDKVRNQFSSMAEVCYIPEKLRGWSFTVAAAIDNGNYLGNSAGAMITVRKEGLIWKK